MRGKKYPAPWMRATPPRAPGMEATPPMTAMEKASRLNDGS